MIKPLVIFGIGVVVVGGAVVAEKYKIIPARPHAVEQFSCVPNVATIQSGQQVVFTARGDVFPTPSVSSTPTCYPAPPCVFSNPRCYIAEPIGGWCSPTPMPSGTPLPSSTPQCKPFPMPPCLGGPIGCPPPHDNVVYCSPLPYPQCTPGPWGGIIPFFRCRPSPVVVTGGTTTTVTPVLTQQALGYRWSALQGYPSTGLGKFFTTRFYNKTTIPIVRTATVKFRGQTAVCSVNVNPISSVSPSPRLLPTCTPNPYGIYPMGCRKVIEPPPPVY